MDEEKTFDEKYAKYYDLFNSSKDYNKECAFLESIFDKHSKTKIRTILDLGCGTGMHDMQLVSQGYEVTGLDLSPEMIKIANSRKKLGNIFVIGDMTNFNLKKQYDCCISMFSSIVYLNKNEQIKNCFNCVKKHLKSGGLFIIDCWNGLGVMHESPISRKKSVDISGMRIERTSYPHLDAQNHLNKVKFKVDIFSNGKLKDSYEEEHNCRFFFPQELRKYLEDAGFEILEICKSYELGTKADENVWNMVLISRLR